MENKYNFDQLKKFIEKESIKSRSEFSAKFERVYKKSFLPLTEGGKESLITLSQSKLLRISKY